MNNISEQTYQIEHDESVIECLCDVVFNNWPDGIVVSVLEIQGINSLNFKREFVTEIANEVHKQIVDEQFEKSQTKKEYYDEQNR